MSAAAVQLKSDRSCPAYLCYLHFAAVMQPDQSYCACRTCSDWKAPGRFDACPHTHLLPGCVHQKMPPFSAVAVGSLPPAAVASAALQILTMAAAAVAIPLDVVASAGLQILS